MAFNLDQLAAQDAADTKAAIAAQSAKQTQEAEQPPSMLQKFTAPIGRVTTNILDSVVNEAEQWGTAAKRVGQDAASGAITAATNMADAAGSAISTSGKAMAAAEDPDHADAAMAGTLPTSPIWDHAKSAILDFRDAISVKDPNLVDRVTQGAAQLVVPFAGFSRALSGLHGVANMIAAGALTDATVLQPHDMRMADLISLARHTEGKLGDVLRTLTPDGSATNAYITYLADKGNESEAEGRFKNVIDGFGVNMVATPLLSMVGSVLKQGTAGIRYAAENGIRNTVSDLAAPMKVGPAAQEGKIGYHGTAAKPFERFDSSQMGTGEGNQAFGWGHYIADNKQIASRYGGTMAQVDVDDNAIADMMHWDKTLNQQPEVARKLGVDLKNPSDKPNALTGNMTGQEVYRALAKGETNLGLKDLTPRGASEFLASKGIPGLRYLDANSRTAGGARTHNTVLFDPSRATLKWGE